MYICGMNDLRIMPATEARKDISVLLDAVQKDGESVGIHRRGKLAAIAIPVSLYETIRNMIADDHGFSPLPKAS